MTDEDLSLKNPLELPIRFSKKNYYDYENLWYKMPFFVEKKGSTGLTLIKKALKFLYDLFKYLAWISFLSIVSLMINKVLVSETQFISSNSTCF